MQPCYSTSLQIGLSDSAFSDAYDVDQALGKEITRDFNLI